MRAARVATGCLVAALATVLPTAACASSPPAAPAAASASAPRPDAVQVCVGQIVYWAGEELRGAPEQGFDYQEMGLTSGQDTALRMIVERARREGAGVVDGQAREACTRLAAEPAGGPWGY